MKKTTGVIQRMAEITYNGLSGIKPKIPIRIDLLEDEAHKYIPEGPFAYISGGAGRGDIVNKNHQEFLKWAIVLITNIFIKDAPIVHLW
jgi:hypothetical protein